MATSSDLDNITNQVIEARHHHSEAKFELILLHRIQRVWSGRFERDAKFRDITQKCLWYNKLPTHIARQHTTLQVTSRQLEALEGERNNQMHRTIVETSTRELQAMREHRNSQAFDELYALALDMEIYQQEQIVDRLNGIEPSSEPAGETANGGTAPSTSNTAGANVVPMADIDRQSADNVIDMFLGTDDFEVPAAAIDECDFGDALNDVLSSLDL